MADWSRGGGALDPRALALENGPLWLVSFYGFGLGAHDAAREHRVYPSGLVDLQAIRSAVGTARGA